MTSAQALDVKLRNYFADATFIDVVDVSGGCGASFEVTIVSPSFQGKPTLKRHREVNELLKDELQDIHAFTQKTLTPQQYAATQK